MGYCVVKKACMTICSAVLIQYQRVTADGQTERIAISISRVSVLTRDKNRLFELYHEQQQEAH